ncbi:predicted protein [Naegleria gruberi]|uniref:Predicted protein n=1 Tax=Naegleria gruberi TaxID=5762 RepID=D2VFP2_NAEGR|nr:uncharacterized protein NAEGRDRAFT_58069 [Naegleria gruberi]EFC44505.1 predicted protein [Naegleria gruberi]|eukprot:XP_002677249.1 predicted protein [Naegleria gruberi strain NEG-M]
MGNQYSAETKVTPPRFNPSHHITRLAKVIFQFKFNTIVNETAHTAFKVVVSYLDKKIVKKLFVAGDGYDQETKEARCSIIVPENILFNARIETLDGIVVHSVENVMVQSLKKETTELLHIDFNCEMLKEQIITQLEMIGDNQITLAGVSIASGGKSTILNRILKTLKSKRVPFKEGSASFMEMAYKILSDAKNPSKDYLNSFTKDVSKIPIDDVEKFEKIYLQDMPGFFKFDNEKQLIEKFEFSEYLFKTVFEQVAQEFDAPHAVFVPIPINNPTMFSTESKTKETMLDYYTSIPSYISSEFSTSCIYCYSKIDGHSIFRDYIEKSVPILDMRTQDEVPIEITKANVLKLFYEWDILETGDGNFENIVSADYPIPFISKFQCKNEEIVKIFEYMHLKLLLKLVEVAHAKISSAQTSTIQIIKKNNNYEKSHD